MKTRDAINRVIITIPTYNEAENIEPLITTILHLDPHYRIVVIDDNSPDGTFEIVGRIAEKDNRVMLLHRTHERGRGTAGIAGFQFALNNDTDAIVEMDADFSHHPQYIPHLIAALEDGDISVGSRSIKGGSESGRSVWRQLTTRLAQFLIRTYLLLPVKDPTSGFRAFRASALRKLDFHNLHSTGPSIVEEILYTLNQAGCVIREIPIHFEERRAGESTLTIKLLLKTLLFVLKLPFRPLPLI